MSIELGRIGAWLNPVHGDEARVDYAVEAERLGYGTVWLGLGVTPVPELELLERVWTPPGPYLVVPEHTHRARAALGPDRLLLPELTVVVEADPAVARAIARPWLRSPYLQLRNYVRNMLNLGFTEADVVDGGSDRMVDALVPHGTPAAIGAAVAEHLAAGADHVGLQVLAAPGADPMRGYRALAGALLD